MLLSINLIVTNFTIFLVCFGILTIALTFFIIILTNKNKKKKLLYSNQLLQNELEQLRSEINEKRDSLEEKIIERTAELRQEIEFRKTVDLDRRIALKNAEEANFLKNAFLANMSHEIRTPLNGIIGFSQLLLNEVEYQEKPDLVDLAKGIAESSDRLLNLMEHIIDLSRIDANDYELEISTFEVNTVINSCIERIKRIALEKNIVLEYKQGNIYFAKGDKPAFEKAIDLVLDNAVKYTLKGKISIRLQADFNKNKLLVLISDTGIGVDKSYLANIFEAFRQDSAGYNQIEQGAGLGLPLAQKLMLLMDGEIQLESEISKGTHVSLILHLDQSAESDIKPSHLQSESSTIDKDTKDQPFIFIVEDDKMNRMVFEKMLHSNAEIQLAIDGEYALKQVNEIMQSGKVPDLILLDINLPAPWDGMLLLKEFKKKWAALNNVPFVAQTAYAMTGDKDRFLAAGFDDYISKPIDKKELFTIIKNNIRKFDALKNNGYDK